MIFKHMPCFSTAITIKQKSIELAFFFIRYYVEPLLTYFYDLYAHFLQILSKFKGNI